LGEDVQDWVIRLIDFGGYGGVFLLSLIETILLPLPSELILPVAGMRAANGPLHLGGVILASTAGSMTGNMLWYCAARSIGLDRLRLFVDRHGRWLAMDWRDIERVGNLFQRFGPAIVFTGRLVPGLRTFVSIPAGLVRMKVLNFALWSTIGTALFAAGFASLGYAAGTQVAGIEKVAGPVASAVVTGMVFLYLWRQLTWSRRSPKVEARVAPR
jgi:membrane protein DedA with SNARE-associated domain